MSLNCSVRVLLYAKNFNDNTWDSTGVDITQLIDFQNSYGIKTKSDVFQIQLNDHDGSLKSMFDFEDRIDVFISNDVDGKPVVPDPSDPTDYDNYFLFSGFVKEIEYDIGSDGSRQMIIQGANIAERLLSTMYVGRYLATGTINKVHEIIINLLSIANINSAGAKINGGTLTEWSTDIGNPIVQADGTDFPDIDYISEYKTIYEIIEELSADKYTEDGYYYYYLKPKSDGTFDFVWRKRIQDATVGIVIEGIDGMKFKSKYGVWDTMNYLIVNCGPDPRGYDVQTFAYDAQSIGEIGIKSKYLQIDISAALHAYERQQNPTAFGDKDRFPSSYDYTTATDGTVVSTDVEYQDWFRETARVFGKIEGKLWIDMRKFPRWKITVPACKGRNDLTLGAIYELQSDRMGWLTDQTRIKARLVEQKHYIGVDGWNTDWEFEQDWEAVSGVGLS